MGIEEILILEIEGLINTIKDYTRENYIISYSNKLKELSYPKDNDLINRITTKLLEWYKKSIKEIEENQFIGNINEHYKSIEILQEIHRLTLK